MVKAQRCMVRAAEDVRRVLFNRNTVRGIGGKIYMPDYVRRVRHYYSRVLVSEYQSKKRICSYLS